MFGRLARFAVLSLAGAVIWRLAHDTAEEVRKENQRRKAPFSFDENVTEERFGTAVEKAVSKLRNVEEIEILGPVVTVRMLSNSGISVWRFTIDFNDGGIFTGRYRIDSTRPDSLIPDRVAEDIRRQLME